MSTGEGPPARNTRASKRTRENTSRGTSNASNRGNSGSNRARTTRNSPNRSTLQAEGNGSSAQADAAQDTVEQGSPSEVAQTTSAVSKISSTLTELDPPQSPLTEGNEGTVTSDDTEMQNEGIFPSRGSDDPNRIRTPDAVYLVPRRVERRGRAEGTLTPPHDQEQVYVTAPQDPESSKRKRSLPSISGKGKGRVIDSPERESSPSWEVDNGSIHDSSRENGQHLLNEMIVHWMATADQNLAEAVTTQKELASLHLKVAESIRRAEDMREAMQDILRATGHMRVRNVVQPLVKEEEVSPRIIATQALYAERGSTEGSAEYQQRQRAQVRFGRNTLPIHKERENYFASSDLQETENIIVEPNPPISNQLQINERGSSMRRPTPYYQRERGIRPTMTGQTARSTKLATMQARSPLRRVRDSRRNILQESLVHNGNNEYEPDDGEGYHSEGTSPETDNPYEEHPERPYSEYPPNVRAGRRKGDYPHRSYGYSAPPVMGYPKHDGPETLDQDYSRRATSAAFRTSEPPAIWQEITPVQTGSEYEQRSAELLRRYIRDSLAGAPSNLPELKGLRAKLPEPYGGNDDFDRFESWLQGLLRHFKLHRLTDQDRDGDRILVAGSCLKSRAERWFNHEVERPHRMVRYWTFEDVVLGLYRAFVTTATTQQAVHKYAQIRYSKEDGVHGFYRELLLWAGRLAQYPDPYSFRRRLFTGLPADIRLHVALYKGVSAENSSMQDIVHHAREYEKIQATIGLGRPPSQEDPRSGPRQGTRPDRTPPRTTNKPTQQFARRQGDNANNQRHRSQPTQKITPQVSRVEPIPTNKANASKLACFKCGKVGHFANDPKCPQNKKPERRQLFAAQVVDDTSDAERPIPDEEVGADAPDSEGLGEHEVGDTPEEEDFSEERVNPTPEPSDVPDEERHYEDLQDEDLEEYDGYAVPSECSDIEYMRAIQEEDSAVTTESPHLEHPDWKARLEALQARYNDAPWVQGDPWEFTPKYGVTHIRGCETCATYKTHCLLAELMAPDTGTIAWKNRAKYEADLIRLGKALAMEMNPEQADQSARLTLGPYISSLERDKGALALRVESLLRAHERLQCQAKELRSLNEVTSARSKELQEELECAKLESSLRGGEADYWLDQYKFVARQYDELKASSHDRDEDVEMRHGTINPVTGLQEQGPHPAPTITLGQTERCAAARDKKANEALKREFRSAHGYRNPVGERPRPTSHDRHCMAIHVKVNGLSAYSLLDTGCTTVSITHDFARVAKLPIVQLENPVTLQLGTVGSRSMINFGTRARIEVGPIKEDNAYLDVVNLDRYDMIIGIPFLRRHGLVLDFDKNVLQAHGQSIQTLTIGQEDLLLTSKRQRQAQHPLGSRALPSGSA